LGSSHSSFSIVAKRFAEGACLPTQAQWMWGQI